jgi:hypothetical protein
MSTAAAEWIDLAADEARRIPRDEDARRGVPLAVWGMLLVRSGLAIALQGLVALGAWLSGAVDPWRASADWWLAWFAAVSVVNLGLLAWLLRREGRRLTDLYRIGRESLRGDLRWLAAALLLAGPIGFLPNLLLAQALWGNAQVGAELSFRALPVAAALAILVVFPVVHAAAELPTYYGYVMPRLRAGYGWRSGALVLTALVLSTQHIFLPLLFDWRYLVWRGLMFLPFALWMGFIVYRRPTTLPYLVIAHGLIDASLPVMVLLASA